AVAQTLDCRGVFIREVSGTTSKNQAGGAFGRQPLCSGKAEATCSTDYYVRPGGGDLECGRREIDVGRPLRRYYDLSDVAGSLHQAERVLRILARKNAMRQCD